MWQVGLEGEKTLYIPNFLFGLFVGQSCFSWNIKVEFLIHTNAVVFKMICITLIKLYLSCSELLESFKENSSMLASSSFIRAI